MDSEITAFRTLKHAIVKRTVPAIYHRLSKFVSWHLMPLVQACCQFSSFMWYALLSDMTSITYWTLFHVLFHSFLIWDSKYNSFSCAFSSTLRKMKRLSELDNIGRLPVFILLYEFLQRYPRETRQYQSNRCLSRGDNSRDPCDESVLNSFDHVYLNSVMKKLQKILH